MALDRGIEAGRFGAEAHKRQHENGDKANGDEVRDVEFKHKACLSLLRH